MFTYLGSQQAIHPLRVLNGACLEIKLGSLVRDTHTEKTYHGSGLADSVGSSHRL